MAMTLRAMSQEWHPPHLSREGQCDSERAAGAVNVNQRFWVRLSNFGKYLDPAKFGPALATRAGMIAGNASARALTKTVVTRDDLCRLPSSRASGSFNWPWIAS